VIGELESLSRLSDWSNLSGQFNLQLERWKEYVDVATDELAQRYDTAREKCSEARAQWEEQCRIEELQRRQRQERVSKAQQVVIEFNEASVKLQENPEMVVKRYSDRFAEVELEDSQEEKEQKVADDADAILDKINRDGYGSLTEKEKSKLEKYSRQIKDKKE